MQANDVMTDGLVLKLPVAPLASSSVPSCLQTIDFSGFTRLIKTKQTLITSLTKWLIYSCYILSINLLISKLIIGAQIL